MVKTLKIDLSIYIGITILCVDWFNTRPKNDFEKKAFFSLR